MVKVSVIIPVYNMEEHIEQCIDSLLAQSLEEYEIICVDDGSTDGTLSILQKYEEKDSRIKVLHQENLYAGVARNAGMEVAQGKYFVFLDSDDFFEPDLLELQYEACEKHDADISICDADQYDEQLKEHKKAFHYLKQNWITESCFNRYDMKEKIFQVSSPAPWTKIYSREFIEKHNLKFQPLRTNNDTYFTSMAMVLADKITSVDKVLVHYRIGQTTNLQATDNKNPLEFCIGLMSVKQCLQELDIYDELRWAFINRAVSVSRYHFAKQEKYPKIFAQLCSEFRNKYIEEFELEVKAEPEMLYENYHKDIMNWVIREEYSNNDSQQNSNKTKVSIIIPVYNTAPYLEECVESIVNQTLKEIEIICINDGSTDESLDVLEKCAEEDSRIKIITQENQGQSVARNRGMDLAQGQYVYFMDSDDILDAEALEYLYQESIKDKLDVLYFDATTFYESEELREKYPGYYTNYSYERVEELGEVYGGYEMMTEFHRIRGYRVSPCLQLISNEYITRENIRFYEGIVHEDQIFNFRTMLSANRVSHRQKSFFRRRVRDDSTMTQDVSIRHIRGYAIGYVEMYLFEKTLKVMDKYKLGIIITQNNVRRSVLNKIEAYRLNGGIIAEDTFTWEQWRVITEILFNDVVKLEKSNQELKEKWSVRNQEFKDVKEELKAKKEELKAKKSELKSGRDELKEVRKARKNLNNVYQKNKRELEETKSSFSFRLGRCITSIPRKIRSAIQKIRK